MGERHVLVDGFGGPEDEYRPADANRVAGVEFPPSTDTFAIDECPIFGQSVVDDDPAFAHTLYNGVQPGDGRVGSYGDIGRGGPPDSQAGRAAVERNLARHVLSG